MESGKRLEQKIGIVTTNKPGAAERELAVASALTAKELKKWDGMDIVRKGTGRKTRYLFVLPAILNATQGGGKLGEITKMDTENPVLYFDFPQGRLKCIGRVTRPEARYLPLKFESKAITCKDIITTLVIFSEVTWIGKSAENPEEKTLPLPASLAKKLEGTAGEVLATAKEEVASDNESGKTGSARGSRKRVPASAGGEGSGRKRKRLSYAENSSDEDDAEEEEEEDEEDEEDVKSEGEDAMDVGEEDGEEDEEARERREESSRKAAEARGHLRRSASKQIKYVDPDDEEEVGEEDEEGEEQEETQDASDDEIEVVEKASSRKKPQSKGRARKRAASSDEEEEEDEEDDDDEIEVVETSARKKPQSRGRARKAPSSDEEEEEEDEEEEDDDEIEVVEKPSSRKKPQSKGRVRKAASSDEEDDDEFNFSG